jgi:hypothetical protein
MNVLFLFYISNKVIKMELELYTFFNTIPNIDSRYMTKIVCEYVKPVSKILYTFSFAGKAFSLIAKNDIEATQLLYEILPRYDISFKDDNLDQLINLQTCLNRNQIQEYEHIIQEKIDKMSASSLTDVVKKDHTLQYYLRLKHILWCQTIVLDCFQIKLNNQTDVKSEILIYIPYER